MREQTEYRRCRRTSALRRQNHPAEDRADEGARAADHVDEGEHRDTRVEVALPGVPRIEEMPADHADEPGKHSADDEGEYLVVRGGDSHRVRRQLVLADRGERASDAAPFEPVGEGHREDEHR